MFYLKHNSVSLINIFLALVIGTSAGTTLAKTKNKKDNTLSELQFKHGDERENDVKALKTELLIASTEEKAIEQTQKLLKKYRGTPLEPDLLLRLAELYMRRAKTDRFLEIQRKSQEMVRLAPKLITKAQPKRHVQKAIEVYDSIEKRFPRYERLDEAIFNNAFASQQIGNDKKAEKLFLKVIREFPDSPLIPDAHLAAGEIDFQRRQFDSALKHFQAIKNYPDSMVYPYGLYKAAWTYYNMHDAATGLKELEAVVKYGRFVREQGIDARLDLRKEALNDMTLFYEDVMPAKKAFSYFEKQAGEIDVVPILLRLSNLYKRHSRHQDNRTLLSVLISERPNSDYTPKAYVELMEASDKLKKRKDVVALLNDLFGVCSPDSKWTRSQDPKLVVSSESALAELNEDQDPKVLPHQLCQKVLNKTALSYASRWLKTWQKQPESELADVTEKAFEIYLRRDEKTDEFNRARFIYADLLFKRNKFRDASENYAIAGAQTTDPNFGHDARYYALVALEKATKDKWSDKDEKLYREWANVYLKHHPKGKYALDVEFKTAFIAYEKGRYDESAPIFKKLGEQYAQLERGLRAQDLYLDILNIKKDYPNLRDYAQKLREQTKKKDRIEKLTKIYEEAYFLIVQDLEKAGKNDEAIRQYQEFAERNPTSSLAQKSLWNAMQLLFKSKDLVAAAAAAAAYNAKFPNSKDGLDALMKAAETYERLGLVEEAAETLERLAAQDPKNKTKWTIMAADFYTLAGQFNRARTLYEPLKNSGPEYSARAIDQLEYISRAENNVKAREILLREIAASGRQPQASLAQLYFVEKAYKAGDMTETFNLAKKIVAMGKGASVHAQGMARLYQARVLDNEFRQQSVKSRIDRLNIVLEMKTEKLSKAQIAFQSAANYGDPVATVAAYRELADSYLHYVDSLRNMPSPKGIAPEEEAIFRDEIGKLALPMEEKAIEAKMLALQQAKSAKLRDGTILELVKEVERLNHKTYSDEIAEVEAAEPLLRHTDQDKWITMPTKVDPLSCPSGDKSWKKETLRGLVGLMNNCFALKKYDRVLAIARHTNAVFPNDPWGPYYASMAAMELGQLPKALWFTELAMKRGETPIVHYQKARVQWALGEYKDSLASFDTAIKKANNLMPAMLFVARVYYRDQDFNLARKHFETVLKSQSDHHMALAALSEVMRKDGDMKDAVKYMEKAVDAAPSNIDYRLKLADLYEGQEKLDLALTALKRAQSLFKEKRAPASKMPVDLDERIRLLESQVNKKAPGEKVSLDKEERVKQ